MYEVACKLSNATKQPSKGGRRLKMKRVIQAIAVMALLLVCGDIIGHFARPTDFLSPMGLIAAVGLPVAVILLGELAAVAGTLSEIVQRCDLKEIVRICGAGRVATVRAVRTSVQQPNEPGHWMLPGIKGPKVKLLADPNTTRY